jgi:hypothetical protein
MRLMVAEMNWGEAEEFEREMVEKKSEECYATCKD